MEAKQMKQVLEQPKQKTRLKIPCEVFTRVCGYFRPVQNFNEGKKEEFEDRTFFEI